MPRTSSQGIFTNLPGILDHIEQIDQLNISSTHVHYVAVTPEHICLRIMVPLEYFRAGHGGKVNEVQDEDMDGQQYGVVDGKHVRDMSDDHKDICKD